MKKILLSLLLLLGLAAGLGSQTARQANAATNYSVVGYIQGSSMGKLSSVKLEQLTHLIYTDIRPVSSSNPTLTSGWSFSNISTCVNAGHAKGIKVLASLAGYNSVPTLISNGTTRAQLVSNIKSLVTSYNLDGIDLDIENDVFPTNWQANFSQFVQDLYNALHPLNKIVTVYTYHYSQYDLTPSAAQYVDMIYLGQYYPFLPPSINDITRYVSNWVNAGFPKDKLAISIPFYGKNSNQTDTGSYSTIVDTYNPTPDQNSVSVGGGVTLYWNGITLSRAKTNYVKTNGIRGVVVFDVGFDKLNDSRSLLQNIYNELGTGFLSPMVTTNAASSITSSGARLNGNLTSTGSASSVAVSFEYGLTTAYGSTVTSTPSTLSGAGAFSAGISGLAPNTVYHYRAKAVGNGTTYGADQQFTTSSSGTAEQVYQSYTVGSNADGFYNYLFKAQTFTPSVAHTLTKVRLMLIRVGNPAGNVVVSLRATDATGRPTGAILSSGSVPCSSLSSSGYNWVEFNLGGYPVTANTRYALVLQSPNGSSGNLVYYRYNSAGTYAGGLLYESYSSGASWAPFINSDALFQELGYSR